MGQDWLSCGDTAFPSRAFHFTEGKARMGTEGGFAVSSLCYKGIALLG